MRRGFTLIELMVFIAVTGIIAALAIPGGSTNTVENACRANMRTIASQEVIYFATHSVYTISVRELGVADLECPGSFSAYSIVVEDLGLDPSASFTITCPQAFPNHGNIKNGVASWID